MARVGAAALTATLEAAKLLQHPSRIGNGGNRRICCLCKPLHRPTACCHVPFSPSFRPLLTCESGSLATSFGASLQNFLSREQPCVEKETSSVPRDIAFIGCATRCPMCLRMVLAALRRAL